MYKKLQIEQPLDPEWMTPFMVLGGFGSKYGLTTMFNYVKIFQILSRLKTGYQNYEPESIYQAIQDLFPGTKIELDELQRRFKCLSLFYQLAEYSVLPESQEFNWVAQTKDLDTLLKINEKYFRSAPMNLDKLG
jgi:hypothetical protein